MPDSHHPPPAPQSILAVSGGFQQSRVLLTAAQLDLFSRLVADPLSSGDLASMLGVDARALGMLLDALTALGFLHKSGGRYSLSDDSRTFLVRGAPRSILGVLEHHANIWDRWHTLTEVVRTGCPVPYPDVNDRGEQWLESFLGAMDALARDAAPHVAAAIGLAGVRRVLDVGGGAASYAIAFALAQPALTAVVLDLPNVTPIARRAIVRAGLEARIATVDGDYDRDELPGGFDLVLLSAIVHSCSPAEIAELFRKCHRALAPGGRLVVRDFVMAPDRTAPAPGALFAINMLVGTDGGGTYTEAEMRGWMEEAGFADVRYADLPLMNALMIGRK